MSEERTFPVSPTEREALKGTLAEVRRAQARFGEVISEILERLGFSPDTHGIKVDDLDNDRIKVVQVEAPKRGKK